MFIPRSVFDAIRLEGITAQANLDAVRAVNVQLNTHLEWTRLRLVQVEFERAALIKKFMGVDIPVPEIEDPYQPIDPSATPDFSDVGDEEAAKLGIEWNKDGTLNYTKK